jgi:hypothetical protein
MRFDHATWSSLPGILAAGYMQQLLFSRAERFTRALDDAGIPYAICGGMAVMAWVTASNPDYVRNTKDVDVCLRRADLPSVTAAVAPHGFCFVEVNGVSMYLDGPDGTSKHAVHVVFAGEPGSRWERESVPDLGPGVRDPAFPWARSELERLLTMKLIAQRMHDQTHVADLWRAGAIDRAIADRLPDSLRSRFLEWIATAERQYGDSPH